MDTAHVRLNILIVEDNDDLRESLVDALGGQGHRVQGVDCAEAVAEQASQGVWDLFIIDLNLPGEDGLSLAARLRQVQPEVGIIMLTARTRSQDRSAGYAQGADIYLTKPASLAELNAAIRSLARRLKPPAAEAGLLLDPQRLLLIESGTPNTTRLNAKEAALLVAFAQAAQHRLEYWQVAEILGMDLDTFTKPALELPISRLRKKLTPSAADAPTIKAIRNWGYQLCVEMRLV
ncbi:MAG: response regulator transcription factor [Gammaproteobacteria bacterium SHHR-1]|uniref:response regulator transcription factor n=1 Tax=Magnetovirga frankeli TaxID=947516 RepID=UPI00129398B0|nr:response regulator transcription factor [gamma proteobacterium SS-5]